MLLNFCFSPVNLPFIKGGVSAKHPEGENENYIFSPKKTHETLKLGTIRNEDWDLQAWASFSATGHV